MPRLFVRVKAHNNTQGGGACRHAKTRSRHLWTPFTPEFLRWAKAHGIGVVGGVEAQQDTDTRRSER